MQASPDVPWPWANRVEPMEVRAMNRSDHYLGIADMGRLTLTMDPHGHVAVKITS